ncbi:hypothetical protein FB451DRAFT_1180501 [Mycena latifolia]|nr:hypothetical protein FB451DRAFT_1180501 [Mycena latifolia]
MWYTQFPAKDSSPYQGTTFFPCTEAIDDGARARLRALQALDNSLAGAHTPMEEAGSPTIKVLWIFVQTANGDSIPVSLTYRVKPECNNRVFKESYGDFRTIIRPGRAIGTPELRNPSAGMHDIQHDITCGVFAKRTFSRRDSPMVFAFNLLSLQSGQMPTMCCRVSPAVLGT